MKRALSFLLLFALLLCLLAGCSQVPSSSVKQDPTEDKIQENGHTDPSAGSSNFHETTPQETLPTEPGLEKLTEQVYRSSVFSEGLAAVVVGGRNGRGCVINKKGEIVFDLEFEIENSYIVSYSEFVNGYSYINGGILDKDGNMTYPEDVGASTFYSVALEGGYIIAEVIEADFSSTKKMLGIMNTKFEWIVEPTEQLHAAISDEYGYLELNRALNTEDYYYNGFVYIEAINKFLNVKTGEIVAYENVGFTHPSFTWSKWSDHTYRDHEEKVQVDLSMYENLHSWKHFENGIAPIVFYNREANAFYFTVVNESGEFLFNPVDFEEWNIGSIQTDGNTIVVTDMAFGELTIKTYDMNGNLIAEFDTDSIGKNLSYSVSIGDGVIMIEGGYNYSHYVWYYTPEFEPLF